MRSPMGYCLAPCNVILRCAGKRAKGASREHDIAVEVLTNVHIALHGRLEDGVVDTAGFLSNEAWLEGVRLKQAKSLSTARLHATALFVALPIVPVLRSVP